MGRLLGAACRCGRACCCSLPRRCSDCISALTRFLRVVERVTECCVRHASALLGAIRILAQIGVLAARFHGSHGLGCITYQSRIRVRSHTGAWQPSVAISAHPSHNQGNAYACGHRHYQTAISCSNYNKYNMFMKHKLHDAGRLAIASAKRWGALPDGALRPGATRTGH